MLQVLKGRNIYKATYEHAIGFKKVDDIETSTLKLLAIFELFEKVSNFCACVPQTRMMLSSSQGEWVRDTFQ